MAPNQYQQQRAPGVQGNIQFDAPTVQNPQQARMNQQTQAMQQTQTPLPQQAPWLTKDQLVQDSDLMKSLTEQVLQRIRPRQLEQKQVTIVTKSDQGNSDREPRN